MSIKQENHVMIFNRETGKLEEELVFAKDFKDFFYGTASGRVGIRLFFKRKIFSRLYGKLKRCKKSRLNIRGFIEKYNIDTKEFQLPVSSFENFNDFFTRKLKPSARPIDINPGTLISPADSRLLAVPVKEDMRIPIKGKRYGLPGLVNNQPLVELYRNGTCLIFRLVPSDYHRFCYIDDGRHGSIFPIKGHYHASSPRWLISRYFPLFNDNYREYCVLETRQFDQVIHVEVGAMAVGKIVQRFPRGGTFQKGEEKGYFEYGASTIILLFKPGTLTLDKDIEHQSGQGIESLVRYGSVIGRRKAFK